ncbi:MAG: serine/threonine-protein kinase [Collinsella sp.]|nr:serine/threonine-protein kinase [Collinsella sp.]
MNEDQVMHALGIDEAYRVERVLARGGAGVTERVTIDGVGPFVRKKIPLARANRGVWAVLPECDSLRLPRVAVTYELPDCYVAVYDFIPGDSLEHVVHAAGGLDADYAVELIEQVCAAVGSLHAHGIIHRDITPGNVIVAADGAHLIDLGNAQLKGQTAADGEHPLGTVGFAAPEQFGFAQTDERSDVYSIGRLLAFMLMGEAAIRTARLVLPEEGGPVPENLRAVIERACAFEPSARYRTTSELAVAVRACGGKLAGLAQDRLSRENRQGNARAPILDAGLQAGKAELSGARSMDRRFLLRGTLLFASVIGSAWMARGILTGQLNMSFMDDLIKQAAGGGGSATASEGVKTVSTHHIKSYVGMNAELVGYLAADGLRHDSYGKGNLKICFMAPNGEYLDVQNAEQMKSYVVVAQNIPAATELIVTAFQSAGSSSELPNYSSSYSEILLAVTEVGENQGEAPVLTSINASEDRHIQYVKDYVGRNLASFGYSSGGNSLYDNYGSGNIKLEVGAEDGSFVDLGTKAGRSVWAVSSQDISPNAEVTFEFERDDSGVEWAYVVRSRSIDAIHLKVTQLPE